MGLDIAAFSHLEKVDPELYDYDYEEGQDVYSKDGAPCDPVVWVRKNEYKPERCEYPDGPYFYEERTGFYAGGYLSYGSWRNLLAKFADGYDPVEGEASPYAAGAWASGEGPFWELIDFSDCEGMLGTKVCQKLLNDFTQYESKLEAFCADMDLEDAAWFSGKYQEWRNALQLAAQGGCILFH